MQIVKYICLGVFSLILVYACSDDTTTFSPEEEEEEVVDTIPDFDATADWMRKLLYENPDKEISLKDICIPRSHDAGTYILQNCSIGANECNTQTQHLNTKRQLEEGIRSFDIRPVLLNNVFFTQHTTGCEDGLGCKGDRIENMLNQMKDFLDEHAELVIIEFGHWCDTGPDDEDFRQLVTDILGDRMYIESETDPVNFINRPLSGIIPPLQSTGKVLVRMFGLSNNQENRALGFFGNSYISVSGSYANSPDFETMKANQFAKYRNYSNSSSSLFEIAWTQTLDANLAVACVFPLNNPTSIRNLAENANAQLGAAIDELIANSDIYQGRIPNIIGSDFCESFLTLECIRISLLNIQ